jgi:hypothetical protein
VLASLLASFTGFSDAFATFLSFLVASLSETSNLFAGFVSEPPLAIALVSFAFLTWAGIRPSVVVESVGFLDFFALIGAASSVAVVYCQPKTTARTMSFVPLRFFAGASEASVTTFFTFLGFSASRSGVEPVLNQYIFQVKTVGLY